MPDPAPARSPDLAADDRHVVVVAGGDAPDRAALDAAWPGWDAAVAAVIAADSGLASAMALGLRLTQVVGDLDSADPAAVARAEAGGAAIRQSPAAKDESDTELALLEAVRAGATRVTVLGAFGGPRVDHALANVALLAHPAAAGVPVVLLDAHVRVSLLAAPGPDGRPVDRPVPGHVGGTVSLLPLAGDAEGVTTTGFRYPLRDERLQAGPARGLSNVRETPDAGVTVRRGRLLVIEIAPGEPGLSSGS
jgi:thiamine pyrophosphokinase